MASSRHTDYVRRLQEDAQRCAETMLADNERLRSRVALLEGDRDELERRLHKAEEEVKITDALRALATSLEADKLRLQHLLAAAEAELERHREERAALERRLAHSDVESRRAAEEYAAVQQRSFALTNLYVASYQLHDSLDRAAVLGAIREVVVNLVGSEQFAVFELSPDGRLCLADWSGVDPATLAETGAVFVRIGELARAGEVFVATDPDPAGEPPLAACVPLTVAGRVTGAIAIFRLLGHKPRLEPCDREIFDLLAAQAGTALYCTTLYEAAQRRGSMRT